MDNKTVVEHLMEIKSELSSIRTDLNYHIRRTSLLEESVKKFEKYIYAFCGVSGFLGLAVSTIKALEFIKNN